MRVFFLAVFLLCGTTGAAAESGLGDVYPTGGRPDGEFEIEVGSSLSDIAYAVFSGEGVKAKLVGPAKEEVRTKKGKVVLKPVPNRYRFTVTVDKDAQPGIRTFRVGSATRLSEPLRFEISTMPEANEALTNRAAAAEIALNELPVCLNGSLRGAEADRYRFQAKKGATLVAFTEGQVLPRGVFCPALTFTDAAGKPCAGVAVYDAATAPVAVFEVPQDGTYALNVADASGKGGVGTVYRIKLGELPLVTGFSPRGPRRARASTFSCRGSIWRRSGCAFSRAGKAASCA